MTWGRGRARAVADEDDRSGTPFPRNRRYSPPGWCVHRSDVITIRELVTAGPYAGLYLDRPPPCERNGQDRRRRPCTHAGPPPRRVVSARHALCSLYRSLLRGRANHANLDSCGRYVVLQRCAPPGGGGTMPIRNVAVRDATPAPASHARAAAHEAAGSDDVDRSMDGSWPTQHGSGAGAGQPCPRSGNPARRQGRRGDLQGGLNRIDE